MPSNKLVAEGINYIRALKSFDSIEEMAESLEKPVQDIRDAIKAARERKEAFLDMKKKGFETHLERPRYWIAENGVRKQFLSDVTIKIDRTINVPWSEEKEQTFTLTLPVKVTVKRM